MRKFILAATIPASLALAACGGGEAGEDANMAEENAEDSMQAAEGEGDAMLPSMDEVEGAANDAGQAVEDGADDASDAVEGALDDAEAEAARMSGE